MGEIFKLERPQQALEFSGERLTTATSGQIEIEHFHRYFLARELCRGKDILDVASGEGYGAALLAQVAHSVTGVDLDKLTVTHAQRSYPQANLRFLRGDARDLPVADSSFDVVVSFETLEHFAEHDKFLAEVRRVLRPNGIFLVSTPDRDVYSPAGRPANPFHARELTRDQFRATLEQHFPHVEVYLQRPFAGSAVLPDSQNVPAGPVLSFERRGNDHAESEYGLPRAVYLLAIASDLPLNEPFSASLYIARGETEQQPAQNGSEQRSAVLVQVYPPEHGGYSEESSIIEYATFNAWKAISVTLPSIIAAPLRLDPADSVCVIELREISLICANSGAALWSAKDPTALRSLALGGSVTLLPVEDKYLLFSYGHDPQLFLPSLNEDHGAARLDISLQIHSSLEAVADAIGRVQTSARSELTGLRTELTAAQAERMLATTEVRQLATERNRLERELKEAGKIIESGRLRAAEEKAELSTLLKTVESAEASQRSLESQKTTFESEIQSLISKTQKLTEQLHAVQAALESERRVRNGLEHSVSWRVTKPARSLMRIVRSRS